MMIACNGLSALKQMQCQQITNPNTAQYNLISAIWQIRDMIPIPLKFEHVKGHQDNGQSLALSRTAWMNIEMDQLAKHALPRHRTVYDSIRGMEVRN